MFLRLLYRDKTPVLVLLMAALVGTLVGLVGVLFEKAVNGVQALRLAALAVLPQHAWLLVPAAPASRKSKARWKNCGRCAGGGLSR